MRFNLAVSSGGKDPLRVGEIRPDVPDKRVEQTMRNNGLSELVVQTGDQRVLIYAEKLQFSGACTSMPKVGQQVSLFVPGRSEPITGKVVAADSEWSSSERATARLGLVMATGLVALGTAAAIRGQTRTSVHLIGKLAEGASTAARGEAPAGLLGRIKDHDARPYTYGLGLLLVPTPTPPPTSGTPQSIPMYGPLNGHVGRLNVP